MKTLTLLSLITLIFTAVQKGEAWRRSTLYIGADDILSKVYLNDNELDLSSVDDLTTYTTVKKLDLALFTNDELKFVVKNKNPVSFLDNAGLAVKILYKDQFGNEKTIETNLKDWTCNGKTPVSKRIVKGLLNYPTWANQGLYDVLVIWNDEDTTEATCRVVIPKLD